MPHPYRFGRIEVRPVERQLLLDSEPVKLGARAFDVLLALIESRDRVVGKNELFDLVWPGLVVEENNLQVQIASLRKLLGPQAIATVPGRGYRFALPAEGDVLRPAPADLPAVQRKASTNLPEVLPPLYGRETDVDAVIRLLQEHGVVSIVGAGGIGKTRLALEAAHRLRGIFPDGVWLVELAALSDSARVAASVAQSIGITLSEEAVAVEALVDTLRSRSLLLVLDTCEHLLQSVAETVDRLRSGVPGVRVLSTSQEPLKVQEEQVERLGSLAVPPAGATRDQALQYGAVQLFVARAKAAQPLFHLGEDEVAAVVQICSRLDGVALAIELAAARVPFLGVAGLLDRIDQQLRLLSGGGRLALARHRTLRAALEWSHGLLAGDEQAVFRRLGVFAGSFSLDAAQQIAEDGRIDRWAALEHLSTLAEKSLVQVEGAGVPRYRLLESTRHFALERLAMADESEALMTRHAEVMLRQLRDLTHRTLCGEAWQAASQLIADFDNLRLAIARIGERKECRDLAIELIAYGALMFSWLGLNAEATGWLNGVRPQIDESTPEDLRAIFWLAMTFTAVYSAPLEGAKAGQIAAELYGARDQRQLQYVALCRASLGFASAGDLQSAAAPLASAAALRERIWPPSLLAEYERAEAFVSAQSGLIEKAQQHYLAALHLWKAGGNDVGVLNMLDCLADVEFALGRFDSAIRRSRELLLLTDRKGMKTRGIELVNLGAALVHSGEFEEGGLRLRQGYEQLVGSVGDTLLFFDHVAYWLAVQGRVEDAALIAGHADAAYVRRGRTRQPSEARSYARTMELIGKDVRVDAAQQLKLEGSDLSEADAFGLAFGTRQ